MNNNKKKGEEKKKNARLSEMNEEQNLMWLWAKDSKNFNNKSS